MRKTFHIERFDQSELYSDLILDHTLITESEVVRRWENLALIFEDLRTVVELNNILEDLLTRKYFFQKIPKNGKFIKKDFDEVKNDLEITNTLLIQSLYTTSIITYAKWFTQSSGGNKIKLEAKEVFKNLPQRFFVTHEAVMNYRHEYFAHSGPTDNEAIRTVYFENPSRNDDQFLTFLPIKKRVPSLKEVRSYRRLFNVVITYIQSKMSNIKNKVISEIKTNSQKLNDQR